MRIVCSGGLMYRPATESAIDDATLSDGDKAELGRLVKAANLDAGDSKNPAARDARQYRLTVERNGGTRSIAFDDLDPNPARRQLVDFVAAHGS